MNYQEALSWICGLSSLQFDKGVERVQWLLDELGNPEGVCPTVHFVGTNGKGSTLNALGAIFTAAGYRVGCFTSPSISDYREQIVCGGERISEEVFAQLLTELRPLVDRLPRETDLSSATEFEVLVVAMLVYMARVARPDILLVEAGLGGERDATAVVQPLALVCPSIGLDHQEFLGEGHAAIARQKVGALKPGIPLVYATDLPAVEAVFRVHAEQLSSPVYALGQEIALLRQPQGLALSTPVGGLDALQLRMLGRHQETNAALAATTALLLRSRFPDLTEVAIREGLALAHWPGRQELLAPHLLIDGAHNCESIAVLCETLRTYFPDREVHCLFAAIGTKPVAAMLEELAETCAKVAVTTFSDPRAVALRDYPTVYPRVVSYTDWLDQALADSTSNRLYLVTGSLYFIRLVRRYSLYNVK